MQVALDVVDHTAHARRQVAAIVDNRDELIPRAQKRIAQKLGL
jgi:hypothetical protein